MSKRVCPPEKYCRGEGSLKRPPSAADIVTDETQGNPRGRGRDQEHLGVQRNRSSRLNPAKLMMMIMMMVMMMMYSCFGGVVK
jgi:hypothetical protein